MFLCQRAAALLEHVEIGHDHARLRERQAEVAAGVVMRPSIDLVPVGTGFREVVVDKRRVFRQRPYGEKVPRRIAREGRSDGLQCGGGFAIYCFAHVMSLRGPVR